MRPVPSLQFPALVGLLAFVALPAVAAESDARPSVEKIIESFIDKETEFSKARESYTYRQSVKILEYDSSGGVRGRWEVVQDVLFGTAGKRLERVVFAPPSSLKNLILTPSDMEDLRSVDCDLLTIGQYMRPSEMHIPVDRFYTPAEFDELRRIGESLGFKHVASGPLVRSSYHADEQQAAASVSLGV